MYFTKISSTQSFTVLTQIVGSFPIRLEKLLRIQITGLKYQLHEVFDLGSREL